mmetsp:Transcript_10719/g.34437  ORF Transcript_10719/g.34437 Transcript_10719/m.34437 type:complete len:286 (-) Transcript_10719:714-1571(-)
MGDAGLSVPGARPQACAMVEQIRACQTQPDPYLRTLHYKLPPAEREKVVEFIAQVCEDFGHLAQTAGLAVTYFDRYCSRTQLDSPAFIGFELAAIICILIAAKFLETRMPAIDELCTLSAKPRTRTTLKAAEMHVLNELGWDLHVTTPHIVLEQLFIIAAASPLCKKRAELLIDMSYHLYKILDYSPLTVAAAALLLSWNQYGDTQSEAKYTELLAQRCAPDLSVLFQCKHVLETYFNEVFRPAVQKGAEKHMCESPVSIFDDLGMADGDAHFTPVAANDASSKA